MAQNSAMMPMGDILSLGHHNEGCLLSPKRRNLGTLGPRCQARWVGRWLCARRQRAIPPGSFSLGLLLPLGPACSIFFGGLWLPREDLLPPLDVKPLKWDQGRAARF